MAKPAFCSKLASYIESFIDQKHASGYPYRESTRHLMHLDSLIAEQFPDSDTLTKEICDAWIDQFKDLSQNTLLRTITPVRQFAKYLVGMGISAYVPSDHIPSKQIRYDAHIFTEKELTAFFTAIDKCPRSVFSPTRCYVIPVFFRLLFTCGLRSSEARLLNKDDVDLATGKIYIRRSKGWEARIIYVSDDLKDLLLRYDAIMEEMFPERIPFFPNLKGDFYSESTIDVWFHEFWDPLPEASVTKGNPPRVHDFRHTFCVYRLNQWVSENRDLNALYPYLSEYVGHSNFNDTDYYLSLAEPFYDEFHKRMNPVNEKVLPEVPYEK